MCNTDNESDAQYRKRKLDVYGFKLAADVENFIKWWDFESTYDRAEDGPPLIDRLRLSLQQWNEVY